MSIQFLWIGDEDTDKRLARYFTDENEIEMRITSFKDAQQLHKKLCDMFLEVKRDGCQQAILTANLNMHKLLDSIK